MTTEEKWAAFVRAEPVGFAYGETCCCSFAMRWAARMTGGEVPGAAILEKVKGKDATEAWEVLGSMGGMAEAVYDVLCACGWQQVETPQDFAIVVITHVGRESAGVWVDGCVVTKSNQVGGIAILRDQELKGIFVWE